MGHEYLSFDFGSLKLIFKTNQTGLNTENRYI